MLEPKPLQFRHYQPRADHPDWKAIHEQAVAEARAIAPLIHTDAADTLAHKTADALRKAKSLATAAQNYFINRRRWRQGNHALPAMYSSGPCTTPANSAAPIATTIGATPITSLKTTR